jgi:hypothetical protein
MIETIDKSIKHAQGEITMTNKRNSRDLISQNPYEDEARKRWGEQAVDDATNW